MSDKKDPNEFKQINLLPTGERPDHEYSEVNISDLTPEQLEEFLEKYPKATPEEYLAPVDDSRKFSPYSILTTMNIPNHDDLAISHDLNAQEALFAFMGWLTTQDNPLVISSVNECSVFASLVNEFSLEYELKPCRENFHNNLKLLPSPPANNAKHLSSFKLSKELIKEIFEGDSNIKSITLEVNGEEVELESTNHPHDNSVLITISK